MAKTIILIQGTMSNAGKSLSGGGDLCRIFKQDGYKERPLSLRIWP